MSTPTRRSSRLQHRQNEDLDGTDGLEELSGLLDAAAEEETPRRRRRRRRKSLPPPMATTMPTMKMKTLPITCFLLFSSKQQECKVLPTKPPEEVRKSP